MNRTRLKELNPVIQEIIELLKNRNNGSIYNSTIKGRLNELELNDVILLQSLMYIGRDDYIDRDNFESDYDYYKEMDSYYERNSVEEIVINAFNYFNNKFDSKAVIIEQMVSKTPLNKYLTQGLEVLRLQR